MRRPSLQSSAQALSFNLQQLLETFNQHGPLLRQAHAYPLPNYPGHIYEGLLTQLLRKKLEPRVEKWIEEHTNTASTNGSKGLKDAEMRDLWKWAGPTSQGIVGPMLEEDGAFGDDFTIAEREGGLDNVVTGLKRKLDGESDDEDDEDDEENEKMEDSMPAAGGATEEGIDPSLPPIPLESLLRFTATGALPPELNMQSR